MSIKSKHIHYIVIIGILAIAVGVLLSYNLYSHKNYKSKNAFLEQEIKLAQNELFEIMELYDTVSGEKEAINKQLEQSKSAIDFVLDSVRNATTSLPLLDAYKVKVNRLEKERETKEHTLDSLQKQIQFLTSKNSKLNDVVRDVTTLKAKKIRVSSLGINSNHSVYKTKKVNKVNHIEVCAILMANTFVKKGNKNIYVQILDVNNNVISSRGTLKQNGKALEYSGKTLINNTNRNLNACLKISVNKKEKLKAGNYLIKVFQDTFLLGTSTLTLN
ncbi:MAG: hypothetical protein ACPG6B_07005 [Oceanihabitans sp.]